MTARINNNNNLTSLNNQPQRIRRTYRFSMPKSLNQHSLDERINYVLMVNKQRFEGRSNNG